MSAIDVVYPLGDGSTCDDKELLYSMRSVRQFLGGVRDIVVIGDTPRTQPGVPFKHIPFPNHWGTAQQNVRAKLQRIIADPDITSNFLLMNDDFFVLKPADARTIPAYRDGKLRASIEWREDWDENPAYLGSLKLTERQLDLQTLPTVDFEVHVPMLFEKANLSRVLDDDIFDWSSPRGLLFRSLYGNFLGLSGVPMSDLKVADSLPVSEIRRRIEGRQFFSTDPGVFEDPAFEALLKELFPSV